MTGVSAEKARQRAEARRLRILAKSAERLDVVSGLVPKTPTTAADVEDVTPTPDTAAVDSSTAEATTTPAVPTAKSPDTKDDTTSSSSPEQSSSSSKGARRMAAMRRRRYQSSKNKKEEEEGGGGGANKKAEEENESAKKSEETDDGAMPTKTLVEAKSDSAAVNDVAAAEVKETTTTKPSPTTTVDDDETKEEEEEEEKENVPTITSSSSEEKKEESSTSSEPSKKYMGVARMRRKLLKEQKAQRLQDIADAEVMGSPNRHHSGVDIERELAAEMATMDVTASMVRTGGFSSKVVGNDSTSVISTGMALLSKSNKRGGGKKWWSMFVPPMKLVPRMVTLLLLFVAGLDLGTQPHHRSGGGSMPFSSLSGGDLAGARDLTSLADLSSIQHVERSLTKPWEYGMGGRVAYMVGLAPSSPPTSLPTSFVDGDNMFCSSADSPAGECVAAPPIIKDATINNNGGSKHDKKKSKEDKSKIKVQLMEDEFDSSRTTLRPKGVANIPHDNDEFADDSAPLPDKVVGSTNNIDPLFQVDLDALLSNANLPRPINYAAKFAIGFHRTWVYYLWTLPTKLLKMIWNIPKNVLSGWIDNPPWVLGVTLLIRFLTRLLVGNGKTFSLLDEKGGGDGADGNTKEGSGGANNLDVLGKVMDTAKNYMTSTFPKTTLVVSTMMQVMKVEMYVVFCGMLIGLVGPLVREDYLVWSSSGATSAAVGIEEDGGGGRSSVLGDGEL